jgi:hypothetical protein
MTINSKEYWQEYYKRNKERLIEKNKKWIQDNPDKVKIYVEKSNKKLSEQSKLKRAELRNLKKQQIAEFIVTNNIKKHPTLPVGIDSDCNIWNLQVLKMYSKRKTNTYRVILNTYAHIIVWECLNGLIPRDEYNYKPTDLSINHIDKMKNNNHISNLELVTQRENMMHSKESGLPLGITFNQMRYKVVLYGDSNTYKPKLIGIKSSYKKLEDAILARDLLQQWLDNGKDISKLIIPKELYVIESWERGAKKRILKIKNKHTGEIIEGCKTKINAICNLETILKNKENKNWILISDSKYPRENSLASSFK